MGLTDKFAGFNVKKTDRISADDKNYLEKLQEAYKRTLSVYHAWYECQKKEREQYEMLYKDVLKDCTMEVSSLNIVDVVENLQKSFRAKVFSYFRMTYGVETIVDDYVFDFNDYEDEYIAQFNYHGKKKEYNYNRLFSEQNYNKILDDVIDKLGGMSFNELLVKEIKDKLRKESYNQNRGQNNGWYISIKGNTLKYTGYGSLDSTWCNNDEYEYHCPSFMKEFLSAYGYIRYNNKNAVIPGFECFTRYSVRLSEEQVSNGFTMPDKELVEKIKIFKNGRVDIKFSSPEKARDFAREWCGYTQV